MDLRLLTGPTSEPVLLAQAKAHLRIDDGNPDDALIAGMLSAAREAVENYTGRALMPQTWQMRLPKFPADQGAIRVPIAPLISVSELRIVDTTGAEAVLSASAYQVEAPTGPQAAPGRILPAAGTTWLATQADTLGAVRVTFQAGYANAAAVPAAIKSAVLLVLGELYEQREASAVRAPADIPAVSRLMAPYRVWWL